MAQPRPERLTIYFHRDYHDTDWVSNDPEGYNRGAAGDPLSDLIEELFSKGKLSVGTLYRLELRVKIVDTGNCVERE
jgi:hypothetical protein